MTERILIPANGPDVEAIRLGIEVVVEIAKKTQGHESVLFVRTKQNVSGSTLEEALGTKLTKQILNNGSIPLPNGGKLSLYTDRTFPRFNKPNSILVVYADEGMLDKVDECRSAEKIIAVPWLMDHVQPWIDTWNPKVVGDTSKVTIQQSGANLNPVVEEGLKSLTGTVNLSTGLGHPMDHDAAVSLFKILKENGEHFNSTEIKSWALKNGWSAKGANQLAEIAEKILMGRRLKTGSKVWRDDFISCLREKAKSGS